MKNTVIYVALNYFFAYVISVFGILPFANSAVLLKRVALPCLTQNPCTCPANFSANPIYSFCDDAGSLWELILSKEMTYLAALILITLGYYVLLQYVKDYAATLLDHGKFASKLTKQNKRLKKQLQE